MVQPAIRFVRVPAAFGLLLTVSSGAVSVAGDPPPIAALTQSRSISVWATASSNQGSEEFGDSDHAPDFAPFDTAMDVSAYAGDSYASAFASQDSRILPDTIVAHGDAIASADSWHENAGAGATGSSDLQIAFELTQQLFYTLHAVYRVDRPSTGTLRLSGPAGTIFEAYADESTSWFDRVVQDAGSLLPGEYTLEARVAGDIGSPFMGGVQAFAEYDVAFRVMSTAGSGGVVPDGANPLDGPPLSVRKLSGDSVRLTWGRSCRLMDSDFEIYEGTIGDPSGLLSVTCSTLGLLDYDFVPATNAAFFLVVPSDGESEGSYGTTSSGAQRQPGLSACRPQVLAAPICP